MTSSSLTGKKGEDYACSYLSRNGFRICERNFRSRYGEIDIIAEKDNRIHLIEVKTRTTLQKGKPYESITYFKRQHLKRAINFYLLQKQMTERILSFDVLSIVVNNTDYNITFFEAVEL